MAGHGAGHLVPEGAAEVPGARGLTAAAWSLVAGFVLLLAGLVLLLAGLVLLLRPRLDRRAAEVVAGRTAPPSRLHLAYVALEGVKALALPVLGAVVAVSLLP